MTVRFETRGTGPGPARTFPADTPDIDRANPVDSLDWPEYVSELASRSRSAGDIESGSAPAGDDVLNG
jgi:DNA polymerase-4